MLRGYKIRIYPTKEQEELIWKHIHACRFMWNYMIGVQQERYKAGEKHLSVFDMHKLITQVKRKDEYVWLREVSNGSLQRVCDDLGELYKQFFKKKKGYPKYKTKKKAKMSYPVRSFNSWFNHDSVYVQNKYL